MPPSPPLPDRLLSLRLTTGESGISCSCGCGKKPVTQSMTSTLAGASCAAGVSEGRCGAEA